jgi:hypothetical protein
MDSTYAQDKIKRDQEFRKQIETYTQAEIEEYCLEHHIEDVSVEGIFNYSEAVIFAAKEKQMREWTEVHGIDVDEHCRVNDLTIEQMVEMADRMLHDFLGGNLPLDLIEDTIPTPSQVLN